MTLNFNEALSGLYVINIGTAFGAGLYETRIVHPMWFGTKKTGLHLDKEVIIKMDVGRKFWGPITTVPLTLLTLASIIVAMQFHGLAAQWWLGAALILLAERLTTLFYFIPRIIKITKPETMPGPEANAMALQWIRINRLRMVLNFAGWICALVAFYMAAVLHGFG